MSFQLVKISFYIFSITILTFFLPIKVLLWFNRLMTKQNESWKNLNLFFYAKKFLNQLRSNKLPDDAGSDIHQLLQCILDIFLAFYMLMFKYYNFVVLYYLRLTRIR